MQILHLVLPHSFKLISLTLLETGTVYTWYNIVAVQQYTPVHSQQLEAVPVYQCTSVLSGRLGAEAATAIRVSQLLTFSDDNYDFMNLYFCEMFLTKCKVNTINSILHLLNVFNTNGNLIFQ